MTKREQFDPERDLMIERHLNAPRATVWRCWSEPALLEKWFAPAPVKTRVLALDLTPGGAFTTEMTLPDGTVHASAGCFLAVEPGHRMVSTDALSEGFRPNAEPFITVEIVMTDTPDGGTNYIADVKHADAGARKEHEELGFEDDWSTVIGQLDKLAKELEVRS